MVIDFDIAKNESNIAKHGVSLERASDLDLTTAIVTVDDREDYGEVRYRALGFISDRLYLLTFTMRGETVRAISLRDATKREQREYAEES